MWYLLVSVYKGEFKMTFCMKKKKISLVWLMLSTFPLCSSSFLIFSHLQSDRDQRLLSKYGLH